MNVASSFFPHKVKICIISKLSADKSPKFPFPFRFYCTQTLKYARQKWFCKKSEKWQNIKLCCNCNLHGNKYSTTCFITDINNDFFCLFYTLTKHLSQWLLYVSFSNRKNLELEFMFIQIVFNMQFQNWMQKWYM